MESDKGSSNTLEAKEEELKTIKEELNRAKDNATESWLDSKPLIDELESLKSDLATAQNQCSVSTNLLAELESQLKAIVMEIRAKREEELRATKKTNELNRGLEQTREELEQLKVDKDEEQRARSKLKQTLRLRRQTLRTLQLTLRAVRTESEAFGASAAEALRYINHPESDENSPVQLTQEDYYALKRRAKEETKLADWRVSVAMEQRVTSEKGQNVALKRLKEAHIADNNRSSRRRKAVENIHEEPKQEEVAGDEDFTKEGVSVFPKARAKAIVEYKHGKPERRTKSSLTMKSKSRKIKEIKKKRKLYILCGFKGFLLRIKGLFK